MALFKQSMEKRAQKKQSFLSIVELVRVKAYMHKLRLITSNYHLEDRNENVGI